MDIRVNFLTSIIFNVILIFHESDCVELPKVERSLTKNGFHRELTTKITFGRSLFRNLSNCDVMLLELLPPGAYIDPFQLRSLREFGGPRFISNPVDVEQPEYLAPSLNVSLYTSPLSDDVDSLMTSVTIPVHLRYHRPSSSSENISVIIPNPMLLLSCTAKDYTGAVIGVEDLPCTSATLIKCRWTVVKYLSDVDAIEVTVPVGQTSHTLLVVVGTLLMTVAGSFIILLKTLKFNHRNKEKVS
ncbi:phosphatidylinositol-glycan biosynthesis class X protein-like [Pecten maximus]|uniref:phosphatidylinositol-glycan biosynthesis class X protein-like n=1 Tax=Pecten maximus TaxID=6579 RepID=UPI0014585A0A|nr:phosphatidylinositol-glycan biosynthesis class X protein-like [Pecten maximus]XP_033751675.1 phosphatidylinositol-glycan biosynthesis class X protein-like [Pecten maximus]